MSDDEDIKDKQVGDYILNDELGSGGFGKVVLGTHIPTGEKVAIKIMDKEQILSDELNKERVLNEISILKIVRHNNIIKLYEVMETPQKIYLVMEYCDNGEMFDYIVSKQHLTEEQSCVFFQEIIDALTYLHSQNIVHRDVKPENILLQTFGNTLTCKLIDFGISRTYTLDKLISTPCGTASYAPPEMHKGEEYYGLLSDVWSAGVLLYAMAFGYLPFCEEDEDVNIDNIIKGNYEIPEEASPDLEDLIKHIMDIDPLTRYDIEQIKKHPWYNLVKPPKNYPGLIIGYHKIPIDERILKVCEAYGFNKDEVEKSVKENKYDNKSSIYYIILAKMKREGYDSISDLYSQEYLNYIKDKKNLLEKKDETDNKDKNNKQKRLDILNDVLKNEGEEKDEKEEKDNNNLEQIITNQNIKNKNEIKEEKSVASENSKNKENDIDNIYSDKESNKDNVSEKDKNISKKNSNKSLKKEDNTGKHEEIIETIDIIINKENKENAIKIEDNNIDKIKIEENEKEEKKNNIDIKSSTITEIITGDKDTNIPQIQNKEPQIKNTIEINPIKEKETTIQISQPEIKDNKEENKETLITLSEKIQRKEDINPININKEKEKEKNTIISKNSNEEETKRNKIMVPKHSFYININTKKLLMQEPDNNEYNSENINPNKLNSSFTQKLTDSLKENVFKMRNPKVNKPNKTKEINNALKEIKKNKKGKNNVKKKENKVKNNKIKKISIEPLFKGNKKNEHTIIHNRNASAVNADRKKNKIENNEKNNKIKNNKNTSTSMEKIRNKNIINNKNNDLNNNIKKIKISNSKEKDKNKNNRDINTTKSKNIKSKKYDKFINKNSTTIKKNENNINSSGTGLMTVSNSKHNHIKSSLNSTNKKTDLKTPSKNLNKINLEPVYKKLSNSNTTKPESNKLNHTGNLNKAIQLSEVKETNKVNKFSYIRNPSQNNQKNIRLNFKKMESEELTKNETNNKTILGHNKINSGINLSFNINNNNNFFNHNHLTKSVERRKINHLKSKSIEIKNNSKVNKFLNNRQNNPKNSNKYNSLLKTEKNVNKFRKFINLSSYDNPIKTEIANEKKGNPKFWKKKQEEDIIKECYYKGPIDLKNVFFGTSSEEMQEILVGILIKNRIKFWKMNSFRFYCKKNGESFGIRIYILSDKIKSNNNENINKSKEEIKISEFDINKKNENNENNENKINGDNSNNNSNNNNNNKYMIFYICVLSRETNGKTQAKQINKIINKKFSEIFRK